MQEIALDIVQQCQRGQTAVFSQIVQHYEHALFAFVARLDCMPTGRCCEDVVQEIFVKVYTSLARFRPRTDGSFTAWLFAIAHNHCMSLGRRKQVEQRYREDVRGVRLDPNRQTTPSPATQAQHQETMDQVRAAIQALTEPIRSTFLLRYYQDLSYADIAQALGCNEQTARTRVTRAKKALSLSLLGLSESIQHPPTRSNCHATKTGPL